MPYIKLNTEYIKLPKDLSPNDEYNAVRLKRELSQSRTLLSAVRWYDFEISQLKDYYKNREHDKEEITAFEIFPAYLYTNRWRRPQPTLVMVGVHSSDFDDRLDEQGDLALGGCGFFNVRAEPEEYSLLGEMNRITDSDLNREILFEERRVMRNEEDILTASRVSLPQDYKWSTPLSFEESKNSNEELSLNRILSRVAKIAKVNRSEMLFDLGIQGDGKEPTPFELEMYFQNLGLDTGQAEISRIFIK